MTPQKRKVFYWLFKVLGIVVSCLFPIWAICEKFPIWKASHGTGRSAGVGGILILFVLLIIFRRTVFHFIRDRFNLKHAPPLAVWLALLILSYMLVYISNFMRDLTTVLWMGFIGCAIGTFLTFIAENKYKEKS